MRQFMFKAAAVAALASAAVAANAADGTITISGTVVSNTCVVNVNGSGTSPTVSLPKVAATSLGAAGATAGTTPFTIGVTGCGGVAINTQPYFEPAASGSSAMANGRLTSTGVANVDIEILNSAGNSVSLGSAPGAQNVPVVATAAGSATHTFYARYYARATVSATGAVTASLAYTMTYP